MHSPLWCTCALTYPYVCVIQLEESRCVQCNITGMQSVGSDEQKTSDMPVCVVLHVKMRQLRGPLPLYESVPNTVLCILHGNIHENVRFLIMDTVTALAFTVFSFTVRYLVN